MMSELSDYTVNDFYRIGKGRLRLEAHGKVVRLLRRRWLIDRAIYLPAEYASFLRGVNVPLDDVDVNISYHALVIIPRKSMLVYRCSFNRIGDVRLMNNYQVVNQLKEVDSPQGYQVLVSCPRMVSVTSWLRGKSLSYDEAKRMGFAKMIKPLIGWYLNGLVSGSKKKDEELGQLIWLIDKPIIKGRFDAVTKSIKSLIQGDGMRTRIHGDLTFDNILNSGDKLWFLDFENSRLGFAEWDAIHYQAYMSNAASLVPSYQKFLDYWMELLVNGKIPGPVKLLYKKLPQIAGNRKSFKGIVAAGLLFTVAKVVENNQHDIRLCEKVLNHLDKRLKEVG